MDANKLMIGDWYNLSGKEISINRRVDCFFFTEWETHKWMQPIPLTEDILKANGFRQNARKEWFFPNVKQGFKFMFVDDMIEECVFGDDIQLHYVHELQHALRLCGLEELADNFKLKMEV